MTWDRRGVQAFVGVRVALLVVVIAGAAVFGFWRRRSDGRIRGIPPRPGGEPGVLGHESGGNSARSQVLAAADLGGELGSRATLVQFSTAFCAPCRATRRVLGDVAAQVDGVRHIDVDAESHLDLVRRLDVFRTPTVFVLDGSGRVVRKAVGAPRKADVIAALGEAI
jgi:thiol-disulfide isomerase/thioredoxin